MQHDANDRFHRPPVLHRLCLAGALILTLGACVGTWPQPPRQFASSPPPPAQSPSPAPASTAPAPLTCELPAPGASRIDLSGCRQGDTIVLRGLAFDIDSDVLSDTAKDALRLATEALLARPDIDIAIHGHTDSTASAAHNQALSERRAATVKSFLLDGGVANERMTTQGFGEAVPVADNDSDAGRARNRRAELQVSAIDATEADHSTPAAAGEDLSKVPDALGSRIAMSEHAFEPAVLTVSPGTTIIWRNEGSSDHRVRFLDQTSFRIPPGETFRRRFDRSGTFTYDCSIHPMMTGTVIVKQP